MFVHRTIFLFTDRLLFFFISRVAALSWYYKGVLPCLVFFCFFLQQKREQSAEGRMVGLFFFVGNTLLRSLKEVQKNSPWNCSCFFSFVGCASQKSVHMACLCFVVPLLLLLYSNIRDQHQHQQQPTKEKEGTQRGSRWMSNCFHPCLWGSMGWDGMGWAHAHEQPSPLWHCASVCMSKCNSWDSWDHAGPTSPSDKKMNRHGFPAPKDVQASNKVQNIFSDWIFDQKINEQKEGGRNGVRKALNCWWWYTLKIKENLLDMCISTFWGRATWARGVLSRKNLPPEMEENKKKKKKIKRRKRLMSSHELKSLDQLSDGLPEAEPRLFVMEENCCAIVDCFVFWIWFLLNGDEEKGRKNLNSVNTHTRAHTIDFLSLLPSLFMALLSSQHGLDAQQVKTSNSNCLRNGQQLLVVGVGSCLKGRMKDGKEMWNKTSSESTLFTRRTNRRKELALDPRLRRKGGPLLFGYLLPRGKTCGSRNLDIYPERPCVCAHWRCWQGLSLSALGSGPCADRSNRSHITDQIFLCAPPSPCQHFLRNRTRSTEDKKKLLHGLK